MQGRYAKAYLNISKNLKVKEEGGCGHHKYVEFYAYRVKWLPMSFRELNTQPLYIYDFDT